MTKVTIIPSLGSESPSITWSTEPNCDYAAIVKLSTFYRRIFPLFGSGVPRFADWPQNNQLIERRRWNDNHMITPYVRFRVEDISVRKFLFLKETFHQNVVHKFEGRHRTRFAHEILSLEHVAISFFRPSNTRNNHNHFGILFDDNGPVIYKTSLSAEDQDVFSQKKVESDDWFVRYIDLDTTHEIYSPD